LDNVYQIKTKYYSSQKQKLLQTKQGLSLLKTMSGTGVIELLVGCISGHRSTTRRWCGQE